MATEQLFRQNQYGVMERVEVPKALGKAAAISRLLAQGGTPFQMSGRYKKGKYKGLTVDEATARAEVLWENSPDSLKQRYADRTTGKASDLAPSERVAGMTPAPSTNASLNAAKPGETPAQMAARQRASRMGTTPTTPSRAAVTPVRAAAVTPPSNSFAPGSDEARAAALTENSQNERLATATVGNYVDMQAAVAAERGATAGVKPSAGSSGGYNPALESAFPGIQGAVPPDINPAVEKAFPGIQAQAAATQPQSVGEPVASPSPAPAIGTPSRIGATPAGQELVGMGWKRDAAGNPTKEREAKYAPIAEVYGAPKTASIQTTGGRITGSTRQTDEQQRAGYQASMSRQPDMTARAVQPPRAIPVLTPAQPSAPDRYATAQTAYQSELDPAKNKEMNAIYSGASEMDKINISGNVMKRAAALNRKPMLAAGTPARR